MVYFLAFLESTMEINEGRRGGGVREALTGFLKLKSHMKRSAKLLENNTTFKVHNLMQLE